MKKTKIKQILSITKNHKSSSKRLYLVLLTTDYITIQPLLFLYLNCVERMQELLKMRNIIAEGPITWQEYDYWIAEHLKDTGFSQESADELASVFVCYWFEQCKIDMFGIEPNIPPIVYPKIIERDKQNAKTIT